MKAKAGFTFLEIMISLAIIGGLLITLIYTLNYHFGLAERHETVTVASFLAREKIIEAEKSLKDSSGVFPEPYSKYYYEVNIKEAAYAGMSEISVIVRGDKEKIIFSKLVSAMK
ncbi:MAG: type II secretion system protein [Nitrospirae bacterium]|nr:type II secretion system protein [Nitrospirota bacterium]